VMWSIFSCALTICVSFGGNIYSSPLLSFFKKITSFGSLN
jgi:hypothetical protein